MAVFPAAADEAQSWKWQESGLRDLMPGYRPHRLEVPTVVAAYQKYRGQGLEELGISLDREQMEEKIAQVTKAIEQALADRTAK